MSIDLSTIKMSEQIRTVKGIVLPYRRKTDVDWVPATMTDIETEPPQNLRQSGPGQPVFIKTWKWETGEVFIDEDTLLELSEQGLWDSQFGKVLLLNDPREGAALEEAGLAVQETKGGYHRTDALLKLLQRLELM